MNLQRKSAIREKQGIQKLPIRTGQNKTWDDGPGGKPLSIKQSYRNFSKSRPMIVTLAFSTGRVFVGVRREINDR